MSPFWFGFQIGAAAGIILACLVALVMLLTMRRRPAVHEVSTLVQDHATEHVTPIEARYKMSADTPPLRQGQIVPRPRLEDDRPKLKVVDAPASVARMIRQTVPAGKKPRW